MVELVNKQNGDRLIFDSSTDAERYLAMEKATENYDPLGYDINLSWDKLKFKRITKGSNKNNEQNND